MKKSDINFILQILYNEKDKKYYSTSTDQTQLNSVIEQLQRQLGKQHNSSKKG